MRDIASWFALKSVPGIGNYIFKKLIEKFGSPDKVFKASEDELTGVERVSPVLASSILRHKMPDEVKRDMDLVFKNNFSIVTMKDEDYPILLLGIHDPPPFLYVYGKLEKNSPNIAFVGTRHPSEYGVSTTIRLCKDMARLGFTIVSGMAKGIDTAAHKGALSARGKTIAVLGSGLAKIYPGENVGMFHKIAENGAVVSEFPLMREPETYNFPIRNRIISGLSLGTVVVEAAVKSGSLITARLAAEQNREVFAVPGSINSYKSFGTHSLIQEGAKLTTNKNDILDELPESFYTVLEKKDSAENSKPQPDLTKEESEILNIMSNYPAHIDDIGRKFSINTGKLLGILLTLELKGIVKKRDGNYFAKNQTAFDSGIAD